MLAGLARDGRWQLMLLQLRPWPQRVPPFVICEPPSAGSEVPTPAGLGELQLGTFWPQQGSSLAAGGLASCGGGQVSLSAALVCFKRRSSSSRSCPPLPCCPMLSRAWGPVRPSASRSLRCRALCSRSCGRHRRCVREDRREMARISAALAPEGGADLRRARTRPFEVFLKATARPGRRLRGCRRLQRCAHSRRPRPRRAEVREAEDEPSPHVARCRAVYMAGGMDDISPPGTQLKSS